MNIDTSIQGAAGIVTLSGRMDADRAAEFERVCAGLATPPVKHIVADLTALAYVSSMGIRSFLVIAQARKAAGGEFVLVGLGGFVKQVFDLTRITPLMRTAATVDEALAALR
jgi:anti-sigma B factor antagonist